MAINVCDLEFKTNFVSEKFVFLKWCTVSVTVFDVLNIKHPACRGSSPRSSVLSLRPPNVVEAEIQNSASQKFAAEVTFSTFFLCV